MASTVTGGLEHHATLHSCSPSPSCARLLAARTRRSWCTTRQTRRGTQSRRLMKEYSSRRSESSGDRLDRMARRLSVFTDLGQYALPEPPRWRIHLLRRPGCFAVRQRLPRRTELRRPRLAAHTSRRDHPVLDPRALRSIMGPTPQPLRAFTARLATIELADAAEIAATNDAGHLRYNGRRELAAIEPLEAQARSLGRTERDRGARQDQRRRPHRRPAAAGASQLLAGIVEQLLVDSKRRPRHRAPLHEHADRRRGATVVPRTRRSSPARATL